MKRDDLLGKRVRVIGGKYAGMEGRVINDCGGDQVLVDLDAHDRYLMIFVLNLEVI